MSKKLKEIGARIQAVRNHLSITQTCLGEMLGVKGGAVSKYENGDADPGAVALSIISKTGKVSLDWLITGKGPGPGEVEEEKLEPGQFDEELMKEAIIMIDMAEKSVAGTLDSEKKAQFTLELYNMYLRGEQMPSAKVIQMVRKAIAA